MKLILICGHYGCGKTNFSINFAENKAKSGEKITLVDMDIVNPYFRSSDYKDELNSVFIKIISPKMAGTTQDAPAISAEIFSVFDNEDGCAIFDVGGDSAGATALGGFSSRFIENGYEMYYLINKFRPETKSPQEAVEILREIETASRLKATHIINNSNISYLTKEEDIISSLDYANTVSKLTSLPVLYTVCSKKLYEPLRAKVNNLYPVNISVKPIWVK